MGDAGATDQPPDATRASGDATTDVTSTGHAPTTEADASSFGPGSSIGRYQIKEVVGVGGSGLVLAAQDTELGRRVAIKVLAREHAESRARLLREAQAMAKLSHPNVVTVHEVIHVGDRAGIVMALVDGVDLNKWRKAAPRSWREIVGVYVQAARGLSAAHRLGLVHRDFKPGNALIDRDGVVRVTDFGLVRTAVESPGPERTMPAAAAGDDDPASLDLDLTRPGTILGTPAYMAPEQHAGDAVDARTDQWSLACSLYEALNGGRPFAGHTRAEISESVQAGTMRAEPRSTSVPRRIRAAIRTALSRQPDARFATMDELIAALTPRSHGGLAVAGVGAAALAVAAIVIATRPAADRAGASCEGLDAPIAAAWNPSRAEALRARFGSVGAPSAVAIADRVATALDRYSTAWVATRTQACIQARQGVISSELLDRRTRCLDQRLVELDTIVTAWLAIERDSIGQASDVVDRLHPVADCETVTDTVPLPAGPAVRAELARGEQILARSWALSELGLFEQAKPSGAEAVSIAEKIDYAAFEARALVQLAKALSHESDGGTQALALLDRAASAAARAHDDALLAEIAVTRFWVLSNDLGRPDEALTGRQYVEVALERAGNPPRTRAHWLHHLAAAFYHQHKFDEALAAERASAEILDKMFPPGHVERMDSIGTIAVIQTSRGELDEAARLLELVLADDIAKRGPEHPLVAGTLLNLGNLEQRRHDLVAALAKWERAAAIHRAAGAPEWAVSLSAAIGRFQLGRWSQARDACDEALAAAERQSPGLSLPVNYAKIECGALLTTMGQLDRAAELIRDGLVAARATKSPGITAAIGAVAQLALARGDFAGARRAVAEAHAAEGEPSWRVVLAEAELARRDKRCKDAVAGYQRGLELLRVGSPELSITDVTIGIAECQLSEGKAAEAVTALEARLKRMEEVGAEPAALVSLRATLGRARRLAAR